MKFVHQHVERADGLAHLVPAIGEQGSGEIALRHPLHGAHETVQRIGNGAHEIDRDGDRHDDRRQDAADGDQLILPVHLLRFLVVRLQRLAQRRVVIDHGLCRLDGIHHLGQTPQPKPADDDQHDGHDQRGADHLDAEIEALCIVHFHGTLLLR
jgi:hypothetical protein